MEFLNKYLKNHKTILLLFFIAIINLVLFGYLFGFHANNDTESFIWTIERFRGIDSPFHPNRYLNPFYPLIGATVLRFVTPAYVLIVLNIIFYFGIIFLSYGLMQRVFKNEFIGAVSALFILPSYAFIRYALTQVQDMGGYFWFVLTLYSGWRWAEDKKNGWLYLGGMAVSLGMLTKESGAMGALFVGVLLLCAQMSWREKIINFIKFSCLPFITLLLNQYRGKYIGYNSGAWFVDNWKIYAPDNYNFIKFIGVNATTYNVLWPLVLFGLYFLYIKRREISPEIKKYFAAVLLPSLSYLAWPIFISRTVFISAWLFIPIASYAVYTIYLKSKALKYMAIACIVICVITPYVLQGVLRYANLFKILDVCQYRPACSWSYFWQYRSNFSVTGDKNYFNYK